MQNARHVEFFLVVLLLFCFCFSGWSFAGNTLERELNRFASDPSLKNATWGLTVIDVKTGRTIVAHNQHMALSPASTQKLITTATALLMLGNDFRYQTTLGYSGFIDPSGILHGNLIVKGSGDPTFASTQLHDSLRLEMVFMQLTQAINKAGIRKVNGRIIIDESVFDNELVPRKWLWEDIGNYFGSGASGLTVNENMYTIFFEPGHQLGHPAKVLRTEPAIPDMVFINQVTTGPHGSGDQVNIFGAPYQMQRTLTGTVPHGRSNFAVRGSIPDPPGFFAAAFSNFLTQNGIAQSFPPTTHRIEITAGNKVAEIEKVLGTLASPTITHIAARTNLHSVNSYAENLLKTIGLSAKATGSNPAGIEAMIEFWKSRGLDIGGMFLYDGSGMSPSNRMTTAQLASILRTMAQSPQYESFLAGFPLAGRSGSLANLFRGTASEGVLRAKSGFISNVRSYAGYTTTTNGKILAFAFIVNDYQGTPANMREKMIKVMDAITRYNQ